MAQLSFDPQIAIGLGMAVLLTAGFAVLFLMRDRRFAPPRATVQIRWCPRRHQTARIEVLESMRTGLVLRSVTKCPLRRPSERCHQECLFSMIPGEPFS